MHCNFWKEEGNHYTHTSIEVNPENTLFRFNEGFREIGPYKAHNYLNLTHTCFLHGTSLSNPLEIICTQIPKYGRRISIFFKPYHKLEMEVKIENNLKLDSLLHKNRSLVLGNL